MAIKTKLPKNWRFWFSLSFTSKLGIFGNFFLIAMGEPNMLQKIQNYLEKAENVLFLHVVVAFLSLIWFTCGDQNNIAKNHQFWLSPQFLSHFEVPLFGGLDSILKIWNFKLWLRRSSSAMPNRNICKLEGPRMIGSQKARGGVVLTHFGNYIP